MLFRFFCPFLVLHFVTALPRKFREISGSFPVPNLLPEILMVRVTVRRSIKGSFRGTKTLTADFVDL